MLLLRFLKSISTRAHLNPPPVLPAQAPIIISRRIIAFENAGQRLKSVVAKPVVVIIEAT